MGKGFEFQESDWMSEKVKEEDYDGIRTIFLGNELDFGNLIIGYGNVTYFVIL